MKKIVFLFILWWLVSTASCEAVLVINEIFPSPVAGSGEKEWVEIYNPTNETVSLENWSVAKNVGLSSEKRDELYLNGYLSIAAKQFLVFETNKVALNNAGDTICLLFNDENVDMVTYPKISAQSYARITDGGASWEITTSTKGESNASRNDDNNNDELSGDYFHDFLPMEIYSCSLTDEKEWVEVQNNSNQSTSLNGWKLKNQNNTSRTIGELSLQANGLTVIEFTSGLLTNSGGSVALYDPNNEEVWQVTFPACKTKGTSFVLQNDNWIETSQVTKGGTNIVINGSGDDSNATNTSSDVNNSNSNNDNSVYDQNELTSDFIFRTPNYKISRKNMTLLTEDGQVLGVATTSAQNKNSAGQIPTFYWVLLTGGFVIMVGGTVWLWYEKNKDKDEVY